MKIMIVEDDAFLRKVYKKELEEPGIETIFAESAEKGIALLQKEKPSLVFLDILMPGRDGYDVLAFMQKDPILATIPVIVLTNLNQQVDMERAMQLGAKEFLSKGEIKVGDLAKIAREHVT
ncbi:MAG: response regulator [Candidatus Peregrinibacteria bacterium]